MIYDIEYVSNHKDELFKIMLNSDSASVFFLISPVITYCLFPGILWLWGTL